MIVFVVCFVEFREIGYIYLLRYSNFVF